MFKILLALLLIATPAWASQWRNGTGEQTILGTSNAALIGYNSYNSIVQPLDNLLSNNCNEWLQYASSSTMTVMAGTCVVSNSQGTIRLFMQDTTNTTITSANLDTGSITASTTYYVYATAASSSSTTSTYYISASNTAPSGQTYYYQIGSFTTDSSSNFQNIITNNQQFYVGAPVSKSGGVVYQAITAGWVVATINTNGSGYSGSVAIGSTSSPGTTISNTLFGNYNVISSFVPKGWYYEVTSTVSPNSMYFFPIGK